MVHHSAAVFVFATLGIMIAVTTASHDSFAQAPASGVRDDEVNAGEVKAEVEGAKFTLALSRGMQNVTKERLAHGLEVARFTSEADLIDEATGQLLSAGEHRLGIQQDRRGNWRLLFLHPTASLAAPLADAPLPLVLPEQLEPLAPEAILALTIGPSIQIVRNFDFPSDRRTFLCVDFFSWKKCWRVSG
jgi:hypothetical protein